MADCWITLAKLYVGHFTGNWSENSKTSRKRTKPVYPWKRGINLNICLKKYSIKVVVLNWCKIQFIKLNFFCVNYVISFAVTNIICGSLLDTWGEQIRFQDTVDIWGFLRRPGSPGQHFAGDGVPPPVPGEVPQNTALPATDGRALVSPWPALHLHHGTRAGAPSRLPPRALVISVIVSHFLPSGGSSTPVLIPGEPARQRLPPGGRRPEVAQRPGRRSAEVTAARGAEQSVGSQAVARHPDAHRGMTSRGDAVWSGTTLAARFRWSRGRLSLFRAWLRLTKRADGLQIHFCLATVESWGAQLVLGRADPRRGPDDTLSLPFLLHLRLWHQPRDPLRRGPHLPAAVRRRLLRLRHRQRQRGRGRCVGKPPGEHAVLHCDFILRRVRWRTAVGIMELQAETCSIRCLCCGERSAGLAVWSDCVFLWGGGVCV